LLRGEGVLQLDALDLRGVAFAQEGLEAVVLLRGELDEVLLRGNEVTEGADVLRVRDDLLVDEDLVREGLLEGVPGTGARSILKIGWPARTNSLGWTYFSTTWPVTCGAIQVKWAWR